MRERAWIIAGGLALVGLAASAWWFVDKPGSDARATVDTQVPHARPSAPSAGARSSAPSRSKQVEATPQPPHRPVETTPEPEAARARLRAQILAAQQTREARPAPPVPDPAAPDPSAGTLTNRTGTEREALHGELNRDFMPLADECIEQAKQRDGELAGMLAVGFEIVVDEELGAVIESVDFPVDSNEVTEPELLECMRASLFSMLLPPGSADGREALMLTLPINEE